MADKQVLALAQVPDALGLSITAGVVVVGILIGMLLFLATRYRRCPANKVLVISGKVGAGNSAKCISGGAALIWPVFQESAFLSLEPIQIDIPLKDALSFENIRVSVPSVFTVAIGNDSVVRQNAATRLLGLDQNQIRRNAQDIIFGQLRQVIASMRIEEINRDRDSFLHNIQQSLEPELKKIGLVLLNVNITDINDESGYIEAIGRKAAAEAVQKARGDVAEQEKLGEVRVAEAERDRYVQVASATKEREIGVRDAEREQAVRIAEIEKNKNVGEAQAAFEREAQIKEAERLQAVRMAELDRDQKIGEQAAAFERESRIKESEQQMRVAVASANATAVDGEAQAQARIVHTQAQLKVKEAEAYQVAETRKREAEAAVQEAQNRAMARAAIADAERVEAERRAAVEAPAKAEKARTIVEAEAEAEKRRIEALAEAAAIYAKLEAEARGNYEILARKGEGLREIVQAAGGAREAFQLLMLEHMEHLADSAAKAISNIKFDKVVVWDGSGAATGNFLQGMAKTLPPMMQVMKDIGGVELPSLFGTQVPDGTGSPAPKVESRPDAAPRVVVPIVAAPETADPGKPPAE
jgi:flotillin